MKGRKRHLVVDTEGLLLKPFVSEAHYADGTVGVWLLPGLRERFPRLTKLWADGMRSGGKQRGFLRVGNGHERRSRETRAVSYQRLA